MGYYINPRNESQIEWLVRHGEPATVYSPHHEDGRWLICHVINPGFTVSAICYSAEEKERCTHPNDRRIKGFCYVPKAALLEFIPEEILET